jgi:hypothetical protein
MYTVALSVWMSPQTTIAVPFTVNASPSPSTVRGSPWSVVC